MGPDTERQIMNTNTEAKKTQRISTRDLVLTGMFTAIICVLSQVSINIQPIPFTLGLFSIFLTGTLLSPRYALLSVMAYLLLGAFGLPVFAGFKGGVHALVGMTGGYLMAYPLVAFLTALSCKLARKYKPHGKKLLFNEKLFVPFVMFLSMTVSLSLCYLIGTAWFTFITGKTFYVALTLCVFPYILFDLFKIVLAISLSFLIRRATAK